MRIARASRPLVTYSAVLVLCVALGGCGSVQGGSTGTAAARGGDRAARHAALLAAVARSRRRLSRGDPAAARATGPVSAGAAEVFAHAVNLTAADVPGAVARKGERHGESQREGQRQGQREKRALAKCFGIQPAHEIVDVKSPQLDRGVGIEGESFSSSVTVVKHPSEAAREIEAVRHFDGQPCLVQILRRGLLGNSHGRDRLVALHISSLPTRVVGAAASAGLRIELTSRTARGTRVSFYTDELAFAVGSVEVGLGAFSVAQPIASTVEQQLLSLLAERARAHSL